MTNTLRTFTTFLCKIISHVNTHTHTSSYDTYIIKIIKPFREYSIVSIHTPATKYKRIKIGNKYFTQTRSIMGSKYLLECLLHVWIKYYSRIIHYTNQWIYSSTVLLTSILRLVIYMTTSLLRITLSWLLSILKYAYYRKDIINDHT